VSSCLDMVATGAVGVKPRYTVVRVVTSGIICYFNPYTDLM